MKDMVRTFSFRDELPRLAEKKDHVFITDHNVFLLVEKWLPPDRTIVLKPGESTKSLSTIEQIYQRFLQMNADRSWTAVGAGGGVVGDITGFAAATYMRGMDLILVPTTLLAQTDAAIGGKNGVNFQGFKNIIGTFAQPKAVLVDSAFLTTLPREEVLCGAAEIVKHALIAGPSLFSELEQKWDGLMGCDEEVLGKIVFTSIGIKLSIVEKDVREKGERRKLNFGHTLGHALEMTKGLSHGRAVGAGMVFAARMSEAKGLLAEKESDRITDFLRKAGLGLPDSLSCDSLIKTIRQDKKKEKDDLHFVFLRSIGQAEVRKIAFAELEEHIHDLCQP